MIYEESIKEALVEAMGPHCKAELAVENELPAILRLLSDRIDDNANNIREIWKRLQMLEQGKGRNDK